MVSHTTNSVNAERWAVVTGGCSGIGLATAQALAGEGYRVLALDQRPIDCGPGIVSAACDVRDRSGVRAVLNEHIADGAVHALVNSAGLYRPGSFLEASDDDFDLMIGVNVHGVFVVSQEVAARMPSGSCIVNISSVASHQSTEQNSIYGATKGAISSLTRGMAVSLASLGIRVNAVAPGPIDTPMGNAAAADPEYRDRMLARVATGRFAETVDVAYAVLALLDERARHITGHELPVDGGVLVKR